MKNLSIAFSVFALMGMLSCGTAENTEPATDPAVVATPEEVATPVVEDPDPTDTIPGDQYLVDASSKQTADLVRLTLQSSMKADIEKGLIDSVSRKFVFFEYDLNEDGKKEIFVGLFGSYFCGSGGCTQYLLDNQGNVITIFTVAGNPVVIDNNKTNGWKDLFIHSGKKDRIVKFDGKKYPSNPSTLPALSTLPGDGLPRALDIMNDKYPKFSF
jgi:hypothetical protein